MVANYGDSACLLTTEAIRFWRLRAVDLSTSKQLKAGAETQHTTEPPNVDRRVLWVDFSLINLFSNTNFKYNNNGSKFFRFNG